VWRSAASVHATATSYLVTTFGLTLACRFETGVGVRSVLASRGGIPDRYGIEPKRYASCWP
jgi:hypothetical protein